jgi:photosystem II protein PsbQ
MKATRLFGFPQEKLISGYRSILSLVLVAVTVFLVSCGGAPTQAKTISYSPADLELIQRYTSNIKELRDRMLEIPPLVRQQRWRDVETFVHGPLGELRLKMNGVTRLLDASVQEEARSYSKNVFGHLVKIDEAAQLRDARQLLTNYNGALEDFDAFLALIPQESGKQPAPVDATDEGDPTDPTA